jgi:hypothetical protein
MTHASQKERNAEAAHGKTRTISARMDAATSLFSPPSTSTSLSLSPAASKGATLYEEHAHFVMISSMSLCPMCPSSRLLPCGSQCEGQPRSFCGNSARLACAGGQERGAGARNVWLWCAASVASSIIITRTRTRTRTNAPAPKFSWRPWHPTATRPGSSIATTTHPYCPKTHTNANQP